MADNTIECLQWFSINCWQFADNHLVTAGDTCDNSSVCRSLESFLLQQHIDNTAQCDMGLSVSSNNSWHYWWKVSEGHVVSNFKNWQFPVTNLEVCWQIILKYRMAKNQRTKCKFSTIMTLLYLNFLIC